MGMGHLHLRKIIKKNTNWIEKNTEKHKHEYLIGFYDIEKIEFKN